MRTGSAEARSPRRASATAAARTSRSCSSAATNGSSCAGRRGRRFRRRRTTWSARRRSRTPSAPPASRGWPRSSPSATTTRVLGVPFYVMRFLDGHVVTSELPPGLETHAAHALGMDLVDTLVEIHAADVVASRARGICAAGQLQRAPGAALHPALEDQQDTRPAAGRGGRRLPRRAHRRSSSRETVVHGDYRLGT